MSKEIRQHLEAKREELIKKAADHLLAGANVDIETTVRRVETYSKLLAAMKPQPSREWLIAGIVAILCLFGAGVLWSFRVTGAKITLQLQAEAVEMKLAAPWSWSGDLPLDTSLVRLEALTTLDAPVLGPAIESQHGGGWIRAHGGHVTLKQFGLASNGILTIESTNGGYVDFYTRGSECWGRFIVWGPSHLSAGEDSTDPSRVLDAQAKDFQIPETIEFRAKGNVAVPTRFKARPLEAWLLGDVQVHDLRFSRQSPAELGAVSFASTIMKGTLTLPDISETVTLHAKDRLSLLAVQGRVVELYPATGINLIFEGTAAKIRIGPEGFERDLTPTYLAYFYHQKPLAFFWGAVVFLWGILWSIRRTLFP
jgi:hypothetical protein